MTHAQYSSVLLGQTLSSALITYFIIAFICFNWDRTICLPNKAKSSLYFLLNTKGHSRIYGTDTNSLFLDTQQCVVYYLLESPCKFLLLIQSFEDASQSFWRKIQLVASLCSHLFASYKWNIFAGVDTSAINICIPSAPIWQYRSSGEECRPWLRTHVAIT